MNIYRDDLERVYALIEKPENWTQNEGARDADGLKVNERSAEARAWCLEGATEKVLGESAVYFIHSLERLLFGGRGEIVHQYNDSHTHAEVLALLKSAIDRAPVRP